MTKKTLTTLATLALLVAGMKGGLAPLGVKVALQELPPFSLLFLRLTVMLVVLLPLTWSSLPVLRAEWKKALGLSLLWAANVSLFVVGIQYTTTIASQLLYAGVPFLVLIGNWFITREVLSRSRVIGIAIGFVGALFIILKPEASGFGSFWANCLIFVATISWSAYLLWSKKFSTSFTPQALTASSAIIGWVVAGVLMVLFEGVEVVAHPWDITWPTWTAIFFLGVFASVVMTYLYQFGLRHGSAVTAASMMYVAPLVAVVTGPVFLGEAVTWQMGIGGLLLFVGLFFSSIFPLFRTR